MRNSDICLSIRNIRSVVISRHKKDPGKALRHVIGSDGTWQTAAE
ncbi:MAG TPA: hypothetical protein VMZ50_01005 [Phycisphaerae bacterium]|nr:hypothetical protein [Phycisphaerae bacterium]